MLKVAVPVRSGVEAAANWLLEHPEAGEGPPDHAAAPSAQPGPGPGTTPVDSFSTQTAGVAGILRREQQLAATTDRRAAAPGPSQMLIAFSLSRS